MLAKISNLPIDIKAVTSFEKMLKSCDMDYNGTHPSIEPILFDTLYDPDIVSGNNVLSLIING